MTLSVIVTAYRSESTLQACVERLRQDPAVRQILVADCSERAPAVPVEVRRFPTPTPVPVMRWAMLDAVSEPVVACLEGRCVPEHGWGDAIAAAHAAHPEAPAIGGAVGIAAGARWMDTAVWLCEYAAFAPPLTETNVPEISGAHLSYKTVALHEQRELLATGAWETRLHLAWRAQGRRLRTIPAQVIFRNAMSFSDFAQQRFQYGREYAAARCRGPRRFMYAALSPALPFLLTARTGVAARRADRTGTFLRCLPGVFFFHAIWSAGELLGYCFGSSGKQHIY